MSDLRYPIGKFQLDHEPLSAEERRTLIDRLASAPDTLEELVGSLSDEQLDIPYRSGGWTVRQVVHHLADSHLNAYVRFRLTLTEDDPLIKTYEQDRWAELADARFAPVDPSLQLLRGLHTRWVALLRQLSPEQFMRCCRHPELGAVSLDRLLALYAWHGRHHTAQIRALAERSGWK